MRMRTKMRKWTRKQQPASRRSARREERRSKVSKESGEAGKRRWRVKIEGEVEAEEVGELNEEGEEEE